MGSSCVNEASHSCYQGCCASPFLGFTEPSNLEHSKTNTRALRSEFATTTTTSFFPNTAFTDHESLPSFTDAFSGFISAYPQYAQTEQADSIRDQEYYHLSNHTCLDYAGSSLFSHAQMHSSGPSLSSSPPTSGALSPFFTISYKAASLMSQVQNGSQEKNFESAIRRRIMGFLNIPEDEYGMVCTANRTTAFKLLAEHYPFQSNKRLLTVYDYDSEAVSSMAESARKRGAKIMSASFSWPGMRIASSELKGMVVKKKKKNTGMFVFPLQSRMTGARYSYLWMSKARENGWHVVLDASALGQKDMDTLGLSLIRPDFIICSFFKVFGENPSGFACLFIKRSTGGVLETSAIARSIGIVTIVPMTKSHSQVTDDYSGIELEAQPNKSQPGENDVEIASSSSSPMPAEVHKGYPYGFDHSPASSEQRGIARSQQGKASEVQVVTVTEEKESSEVAEFKTADAFQEPNTRGDAGLEIECRGLDHADSMGLLLISCRLRCITNWLVNALTKLRHPRSDNGHHLVKIYGPRIKFDRAPAVAFNIFDWKGERVDPALVQKLADRSNISLSCGFLRNIRFSEKYVAEKEAVLKRMASEATIAANRMKLKNEMGISVLSASLGFMSNFEDAYRLWAFVAKFLDADFVEKERWRCMALNHKMVEI